MLNKKEKKYDVGVIVGRFQVDELHNAHKKLVQGVIAEHKKTIVFLGRSPCRVTRNNPLDYESRQQMLLKSFPDITVLYINDVNCDGAWSKNLDTLIIENIGPTTTAVLYGGRDSFINHYAGNFPTCELEQEGYISGSEIRKDVSIKTKASSDFRAGVIWVAYNQYPKAIPTVDVAIWDSDRNKLLLARKKNEPQYRFIGGFAQGQGNYEQDARREVEEEAHIEISDPQYLFSHVVDDWRYRKEIDNIVTLFFEAIHVFGKPEADDDIVEVRWFDINEIKESDLVLNHVMLFKTLLEKTKIKQCIKLERRCLHQSKCL
jgi:bifunctional NMN adenylyltransferase/nudix hydrolase